MAGKTGGGSGSCPRRTGPGTATGRPAPPACDEGPCRAAPRARDAAPARPAVPPRHQPPRRPPLDRKPAPPPTATRRERREADRRDRFEADRARRRSTAGRGGTPARSSNGRLVTVGILVVGILLVGAAAFSQLGSRDDLEAPGDAYPVSLVDGRAIGAADAPVVMEVYEDFQCPVCARYSLEVEPILVSRYVAAGQLRIVHRDIAILGNRTDGDESRLAGRGAYCADEQDAYWGFSHWLYNNQDGENAGGFRRERVLAIAEAAGLDVPAFTACLDGTAAAAEVTAVTDEAIGRGLNSTPTFFVNGEQVSGLRSADEMGALIEAALAAVSPAP